VNFLSGVLAWAHKVTSVDQMELSRYGKRADPKIVMDYYRDSLLYDCTDDLSRLSDIPILVLYGSRTFHINPHHKLFKDKLPNVKIAFVDKATHQLPIRFHEPFNHAITHFLKGIRKPVY